MNAPKVRFIADLVEEHLDELAFLWGQRRAAIGSPTYTVRSFRQLEERIEGHAQGVLVAGESARPLLDAGLASADALAVFAAAYLALRRGDAEAAERIAAALADAKDGVRESLRDAFCHAPIDLVESPLRAIVREGAPPAAIAAAEALARHGKLEAGDGRLSELLRSEDAAVRRNAWSVVAIVDGGAAA